jgi:hypothetical protein
VSVCGQQREIVVVLRKGCGCGRSLGMHAFLSRMEPWLGLLVRRYIQSEHSDKLWTPTLPTSRESRVIKAVLAEMLAPLPQRSRMSNSTGQIGRNIPFASHTTQCRDEVYAGASGSCARIVICGVLRQAHAIHW